MNDLLHADIDDIIDAEYEAEEQSPFRNKHITVDGAISISGNPRPSQILCIVTNDDLSKTLTVVCAGMQIIIPFEKLSEYLK